MREAAAVPPRAIGNSQKQQQQLRPRAGARGLARVKAPRPFGVVLLLAVAVVTGLARVGRAFRLLPTPQFEHRQVSLRCWLEDSRRLCVCMLFANPHISRRGY
jgi:hypothetical protein